VTASDVNAVLRACAGRLVLVAGGDEPVIRAALAETRPAP
jgi:hypothetical protein